MLYLESRLIAFQRKMQQSGISEALCMPESALETYIGFSRQVSWIISFTYRDGHYVKCWLVLWVNSLIPLKTTPTNECLSHASFLSGIMLLLGICQNLLRQSHIEPILIDLLSVKDNCNMLGHVSESSSSGSSFHRLLEPLYLQTKDIVESFSRDSRPSLDNPMDINTIVNIEHLFDPSALVSLMGELINALHISDVSGYE
jgi:hypothetical protein